MAYMIGAYQYFDDAFLYSKQDLQQPKVITYTDDSLLGFLKNNFPDWYLIIQKAGRLNYFNNNQRYTMFVPIQQDTKRILTFDRQSALHAFNLHTMRGSYDKAVLNTSQFQYLSTLTDGQPLYYSDDGMINRHFKILQYDLVFDNVTIHIISDYISF